MNKMTKILLGILGVSLVPLAMLGAMLYFGRTADEPASGTIDLGSVTESYTGTEYAGTTESVSDTDSDIIDNVNFFFKGYSRQGMEEHAGEKLP